MLLAHCRRRNARRLHDDVIGTLPRLEDVLLSPRGYRNRGTIGLHREQNQLQCDLEHLAEAVAAAADSLFRWGLELTHFLWWLKVALFDPVATTTPGGLLAWGPRSAHGSEVTIQFKRCAHFANYFPATISYREKCIAGHGLERLIT